MSEPAVPPPTASRIGYILGVDGLRAVAVLSVMLYHLNAAWMPGGFVGVDVFFVISGFVVTGSLYRHRDDSLGAFLAGFYSRRFRRILPALMVCLWVAIFAVLLFIPPSWLSTAISKTSLQAFYGFSNNALVATSDGYFAPRTEFNPFTHTWSLAVEEQFYALFPPVLFGWWFMFRRSASQLPVIWLLLPAIASFVWCAMETTSSPDRAYYLLVSRYWELAVGAALFLWQSRRTATTSSRAGWSFVLTSGVALILVTAVFADARRFPFPWAIPAVAGTMFAIAGLTNNADRPNIVARALRTRAAAYIGLLSYSLYLWHWPIYVMLRWTVGLDRLAYAFGAIAVTFLCSWLSYLFIERPAQLNRRLSATRPSVVIAVGLAAVVLSVQVAQRLYWRQSTFSRSVVVRHASDWYPDSDEPVQSTPPNCAVVETVEPLGVESIRILHPSKCRSHVDTTRTLFVLGDSHAGAYVRMMRMIVSHEGFEVRIYTHGGCAIGNLLTPARDHGAACLSFEPAALQQVASLASSRDVVFLASLRSARFGDQWSTFPADVVDRATSSDSAALSRRVALAEADTIVGSLLRTQATVIMDAPKPVFGSPPFRCADWYDASNPVCRAGFHVKQATLKAHQRPVNEALQTLKTRYPTLVIFDPMLTLCPVDPCSAFASSGAPLFFDGDHLSGFGNALLFPAFRTLIADHALVRAENR